MYIELAEEKQTCNKAARVQPPPQQKQIIFTQSQKSQTVVHFLYWTETIWITTRKDKHVHFLGFLQIQIYAYKAVKCSHGFQ